MILTCRGLLVVIFPDSFAITGISNKFLAIPLEKERTRPRKITTPNQLDMLLLSLLCPLLYINEVIYIPNAFE